jgi:hypothetical protein
MQPFQYKYTVYRNGINGKRQLPFVFCKQKTETTKFYLFSANGKTVIDICYFSKRAHLCVTHIKGTNISLKASFEEKPPCPDHMWAFNLLKR